MAYQTPAYDYGKAQNKLSMNKGFEDTTRNYSRYLSQERFRRGREDMDRSFKRTFPKVGQSFNSRGMWNSGLRRGGQRQFTQDVGRDKSRLLEDQGNMNAGYQLQQTQADARYQMALQDLFDQMQAARAAQDDPFSGVRGMV